MRGGIKVQRTWNDRAEDAADNIEKDEISLKRQRLPANDAVGNQHHGADEAGPVVDGEWMQTRFGRHPR